MLNRDCGPNGVQVNHGVIEPFEYGYDPIKEEFLRLIKGTKFSDEYTEELEKRQREFMAKMMEGLDELED